MYKKDVFEGVVSTYSNTGNFIVVDKLLNRGGCFTRGRNGNNRVEKIRCLKVIVRNSTQTKTNLMKNKFDESYFKKICKLITENDNKDKTYTS